MTEPGVTLGEPVSLNAQAGKKRVSNAYHFYAYHLPYNAYFAHQCVVWSYQNIVFTTVHQAGVAIPRGSKKHVSHIYVILIIIVVFNSQSVVFSSNTLYLQ